MTGYEAAFERLNEAQRLAVETTEGPVLVIAGPGTGKTQLLTTRIAHILATRDVLPQNILCLTFTDSAAQNMRDRLSGMVGQAAYDVTISTYHAFGSELIRRFSDYFSEMSDMQPADDLTIDAIFRAIVEALPYSNPLKFATSYLGDVKTIVSDAKRALLTPDDLRRVASANDKYIRAANPIVADTLGVIVRMDKKSIPLFASLLEKLSGLTTTKPPADSVMPLSAQLLQELNEAVEAAMDNGKPTELTKWKNSWLVKDGNGHFVVDGERANQKLRALANIYEQYLETLAARKLFDYDDMIIRAVNALETHDDLRFTLQERYQYILLDEFQDTNGAQLRLVQLLTDNPVNEGRPNVLAVGDDDQAIYAFQGANYSHMLQFAQMFRDVLTVPLTKNYRSHADILHVARGIAEQIEERLHHHFPQIEKNLTAENKKLPDAVVERREAKSDVGQFAWVAKRIRQLIDSGVPPEEIAVLAPKHRHLEPLVPFLQQENIPVRYEKRENVLDDPAINQLLRMSELALALAAGDHHRANALWSEVLSFGFWELPTSLIWQFSWQASGNHDNQDWTPRLLADERLKPIALFFIRLSQLAGTETLESMLDYIIGVIPLDLAEPGLPNFQSPFYEHYFGDGDVEAAAETKADFWELLTNLTVLRARLREYRPETGGLLKLQDFTDFVEAHRHAEIKILNTSPYATGIEAVQLMTAYKAKGMEFAAVFLLAVNDEVWGSKARTQSSHLSLPPNLQFIRYAGATNDERLRLFYVAITRAKTQLYLVNYSSNFAGKTTSRLKYLDESIGEDGTIHSPLLPEKDQLVLPAEDGVATPTTELAAYWQRRHEIALGHEDMRALLEDRLKDYQISPTHVADFIDFVHCGPQSFFMLKILRFPQAPRPEVQYGNAMHETLEWIHYYLKNSGRMPTKDEIFAKFTRQMEAKRLNLQTTGQLLERGKLALTAYLAQRAGTISSNNEVEVNFRNEGVFAGKAHLGGKVDKLIIDRANKTITIVDYKTGRSHTRWERDITLHKNRQQLYFYKALVEGSHTYAGYKVTSAYLEFVEPDENGQIQELHLKFDDTEFRQSKHLFEAIWTKVKTLDIPETTQYPQDLKGIEQFEQDLLEPHSTK